MKEYILWLHVGYLQLVRYAKDAQQRTAKKSISRSACRLWEYFWSILSEIWKWFVDLLELQICKCSLHNPKCYKDLQGFLRVLNSFMHLKIHLKQLKITISPKIVSMRLWWWENCGGGKNQNIEQLDSTFLMQPIWLVYSIFDMAWLCQTLFNFYLVSALTHRSQYSRFVTNAQLCSQLTNSQESILKIRDQRTIVLPNQNPEWHTQCYYLDLASDHSMQLILEILKLNPSWWILDEAKQNAQLVI